MKKRLVATVALSALFLILIGCFGGEDFDKSIEDVDQSTRIISYIEVGEKQNITTQELHYLKDEKLYVVPFPTKIRPALDWLKENSNPSDKVLSWWDNGHVLRGYARREPIVYTPTYALLETVSSGKWDEEEMGEFSDSDTLTDVSYALLADTPVITQSVMNRYGARWAFVLKADQKKIYGMATMLGENLDSYVDDLGEPKTSVMHKIIFKMSDGWPLKGFELRYEDDYAFVYERI